MSRDLAPSLGGRVESVMKELALQSARAAPLDEAEANLAPVPLCRSPSIAR